jgi:hypothetical protein
MNKNANKNSRWLFCASSKSDLNNSQWSRLNLEASGVAWVGNPVRTGLESIKSMLSQSPIWSSTDTQLWTSESDALGEWGVVWEL